MYSSNVRVILPPSGTWEYQKVAYREVINLDNERYELFKNVWAKTSDDGVNMNFLDVDEPEWLHIQNTVKGERRSWLKPHNDINAAVSADLDARVRALKELNATIERKRAELATLEKVASGTTSKIKVAKDPS